MKYNFRLSHHYNQDMLGHMLNINMRLDNIQLYNLRHKYLVLSYNTDMSHPRGSLYNLKKYLNYTSDMLYRTVNNLVNSNNIHQYKKKNMFLGSNCSIEITDWIADSSYRIYLYYYKFNMLHYIISNIYYLNKNRYYKLLNTFLNLNYNKEKYY